VTAREARLEDPQAPETDGPQSQGRGLVDYLHRIGSPSQVPASPGSTGEACLIEGFDCILLDQDPQALALTRVRLAKPVQPSLFGEAS